MQCGHTVFRAIMAAALCACCVLLRADDTTDETADHEPRELRVAAKPLRPVNKKAKSRAPVRKRTPRTKSRSRQPSPESTSREAERIAQSITQLPRAVYKPEISALNLDLIPKPHPYGQIQDRRGLRPYKPGVKYDRDERDSGFFGLFGGGR